jgi:methionine sulfoxide reductase heme-binding subunit
MNIARDNGYGLARQNLTGWLAATLAASLVLAVGVFSQFADVIESWQLWARYTARLSFFLFLASYIASPLYEVVQNRFTEGLRRDRRNAGISFGVAHTIHLIALIGYLLVSKDTTDAATIIVGGGAYIAMFLMLASSNDAAVRRLGKIKWRRLHKFGAHYLAFVFAFTYTNGYFAGYGKPIILIILIWAAIVLRIFVSAKARQEAIQ